MQENSWYFISKTELHKVTPEEAIIFNNYKNIIPFTVIENNIDIKGFAFTSEVMLNLKTIIPMLKPNILAF